MTGNGVGGNAALARVGLCLEDDPHRSFASAPAQVTIGGVEFGGWQIHHVEAASANFSGADAYLVKANYDVALTGDAPEPIWLEAGFEFLNEGVAVADAIPRAVREPAAARNYILTAHLAFAHLAEMVSGSVEGGRPLSDPIPVPALDPVVDVFGVGGRGVRWRHSMAAVSPTGSQVRWLALVVPGGQLELDVQAFAAYASTPYRLMGKHPLSTPEEFTVRLPTHRPLAWTGPTGKPALEVRMGFVIDVVGYSQRTEPRQYEIQQRLVKLLHDVMSDIGVELNRSYVQGAGDGMNVFLPPDSDIGRALPALITTTATRLAEDNSRHSDRIRLRMATDLGPVRLAPAGFSGRTIVGFCRLVSSGVIREAIADHPDIDLAVLVSEWLYEAVISQGYADPDRTRFSRVHAVAKGFQSDAWLWTSTPSWTSSRVDHHRMPS